MIKYNNCKNCISNCEHAGKDREFVCPNGVSCKTDRATINQERTAREFIKAIKTLSQHPERLDNLELYLSSHFSEWMQKFAKTPEDITYELLAFAEMEV